MINTKITTWLQEYDVKLPPPPLPPFSFLNSVINVTGGAHNSIII